MSNNDNNNLKTDGLVLLKNLFTIEESENIIRWANELENYPEEKGKWMIYFEEGKKKSRIENFLNYHKELQQFINNKVKNKVEEVLGEKINLFKEKLNWKYGGGNGFKSHQDHPAFNDFPCNIFYTVALFANNSTKENGCLEFSKGNYRDNLLSYDKNTSGKISQEIEDKLKWEKIETTPRDLVIFDSYVPHRSDKNTTNNSRRIFYFTYNLESEGDHFDLYLTKKRLEFPPDIEREEGKEYKSLGNKYNLANPIK